MINLRISQERAIRLLNTVPHMRFQNAIASHWKVDNAGHIAAQSVCWLFCWGKTGMGSNAAKVVACNVFDEVFSLSFDEFEKRIPHEWARGARYNTDSEKIEMELKNFLE